MFNDLTHSYNGTDATLEILILLAVSFLFGMMFAYYLWAPQKNSAATGAASPAPVAENPGKSVPAVVSETPVAAQAAPEISPAPVEIPVADISPAEPSVETAPEISGYEEPVSLDFEELTVAADEPTVAAEETPGATDEEIAHIEQLLSDAARPLDELDEPAGEPPLPAEEPTAPEITFDLPPFVLEYPIATETPEDDFQKIDGIGPVIERALKNGGIRTYAQLASSGQEDIMAVLLAASERNKRFQALCASWPDQAALARDGHWEELENRREAPSDEQ
jgi:predicted flap endonuclease-1-like 5' DNA nuclease